MTGLTFEQALQEIANLGYQDIENRNSKAAYFFVATFPVFCSIIEC